MSRLVEIKQWCTDNCGLIGINWTYYVYNTTRDRKFKYNIQINVVYNDFGVFYYTFYFDNVEHFTQFQLTWG